MKVLYLNPGSSALGGAERSLALLVQGMVSRGHEVFVEVFVPGDASRLFADAGATVLNRAVRLDRVRRHGTATSFIAGAARSAPTVLRLASLVRDDAVQLQADIVHSNGFRTHLLAPLLRRGHLRQVWSLRDRAPRRSQRAVLAAASVAVDAVVANSGFTARQLTWRRGLVHVVPNPVAAGRARPRSAARVKLGLPEDRKIVAVVAHLHPSKGHHVAVEAMARWTEGDRPLLAIAGAPLYGKASSDYQAQLDRLVASYGLDRDVVLLGGVTDVDVLYSAADVVIQPAVYPEGFGRVVVEAQLAGVPVVATAIGGTTELIDHGASGLLVPPGDAAALRSATSRALYDAELAARLVNGGRSAASVFSTERHVDAVEKVYSRVLSR
ncbi:MAG: glycosyltransferase family 4 protein [Actinomycetota bacterium]|nr:glycosyltransferase family 4 protein [Actinomycetota bacterium]